jgi:hypothetical protein
MRLIGRHRLMNSTNMRNLLEQALDKVIQQDEKVNGKLKK